MSKYQKRHYEDVACLLFTRVAPAMKLPYDAQIVEVFTAMAADFADLFAADNPLFNRERFFKACGLDNERPV